MKYLVCGTCCASIITSARSEEVWQLQARAVTVLTVTVLTVTALTVTAAVPRCLLLLLLLLLLLGLCCERLHTVYSVHMYALVSKSCIYAHMVACTVVLS
jgi:apolipoprotein N-acyltransferase